MSNNFMDIENIKVERQTRTDSPHKKIRFHHPLTILFTYRQDWVVGDTYWVAEIEELSNKKLLYIGTGNTQEEAERALFDHLALVRRIQEDLDSVVSSLFARKIMNERKAILHEHIDYVDVD